MVMESPRYGIIYGILFGLVAGPLVSQWWVLSGDSKGGSKRSQWVENIGPRTAKTRLVDWKKRGPFFLRIKTKLSQANASGMITQKIVGCLRKKLSWCLRSFNIPNSLIVKRRDSSPQKFSWAGIMIILVLMELLPTAHRYDPHDSVVTTSFLAWDFWELYQGSTAGSWFVVEYFLLEDTPLQVASKYCGQSTDTQFWSKHMSQKHPGYSCDIYSTILTDLAGFCPSVLVPTGQHQAAVNQQAKSQGMRCLALLFSFKGRFEAPKSWRKPCSVLLG